MSLQGFETRDFTFNIDQSVAEDAGVFDIRRSSTTLKQDSSDLISLVSSQDDLSLLRTSSASLEEFSADSLLLQQRPAPSLDYFNELKLSSSADLQEAPVEESSAPKPDSKQEEKKQEETKVAKLIYIEESGSPRSLTALERERLAQREASRSRKAQRYAEKKKLLQERPPSYFSSVTHVSDPSREIFFHDAERPAEKRSVTPGNAAKLLTGRGWVTGFVSFVNATGTRVGISYKGVSNSWWNHGRERIFTSVLPYFSSDWYPIRTKTIPGSARRGRPAKIDHSAPNSGRSNSEDTYTSSSSHSYSSSSASTPYRDDTGGGSSGYAGSGLSIVPRKPTKPSSKHIYEVNPALVVDTTKRFRFQPRKAGASAEPHEDEPTSDDGYAARKLARQQASYERYMQFLDNIKATDPKTVFRVRVVIEPSNKAQDDVEEEDDGPVEDAVPVLTSAVQYADVDANVNLDGNDEAPRASIFFDRVDDHSKVGSDFFGGGESLFALTPSSDEGLFFTDLDERSKQLFDEYMEFALQDALDSSTESDWDLTTLSSSGSSTLLNSTELENDEILMRKSASLAFVEEGNIRLSGSVELPDHELLHQLNDGILAPEDTGGFDLADMAKHYGYIASAPNKKIASRDVIAAKITAQEAEVVTSERAPASTYSVIRDDRGLEKVLQPELASKNHTAIPAFEAKRGKGMGESLKALTPKELVFASEQSLTSLMGEGNVEIYFDGSNVKKIEEITEFLNPTGGFVDGNGDATSSEALAEDENEEDRPSLESLWKYIDLDNLRVDTLIDKPKKEEDKKKEEQKKRDPLQRRKPKATPAPSETPVPQSATPVKLECQDCNATFRTQWLLNDHLQSRLHREISWRNKMKKATINNYGSLEDAPGGFHHLFY
eukprot:TRINITY_DN4788_c0_g1_i1.p1 TRINITY_DN4788_c0_g1~~TRINITY_DN4788_c0_g1_i1.p1  ORF type:complete len:890 (-),score=211.11 TRINITY_DN4788_c0_g1_i1:123-2792(-)